MVRVSRGDSPQRYPARPASTRIRDLIERTTREVSPWITEDDPSKSLIGYMKQLLSAQTGRLFDNLRMMSLYANYDFMSEYQRGNTSQMVGMPRMADNQVKKHTDTLVGKLVQANSRIKMLTTMGDMDLWNKARKRENALAGEWARMGFFREAQKVANDGIVCGTGALKLFISDDGERIDCQRVFPNELFVDDMESLYGMPRKMYQMRYVAKDTLAAQFPDKAQAVLHATAATPPTFGWTRFQRGMVEVVEAWALPVGERPGRHVIVTSGGCLVDEEWNEQWFPFVVFKPYDLPLGWYGQGLVCQVYETQAALNKMLNIMETGARLAIAPFWVVAEGSTINARHLSNIPGHIVETAGAEPKWVTNPPFHQAAPAYCQMLRQEIADMFGNSQMDTGGDPTGQVRLDSKRALKEYQDIGSSRITTLIERWSNDFFIDAADRTMMLAGRIAKAKGAYPVLVKDSLKKAVQLDWADLDMDKDAYIITPAPTNVFSANPSARLDQLTEMMQAGLITQKQAQRQMQGSRDIDAMLGEASATEDDLDDLIEGFVERGEYRAPTSLQDLQRGLVRVANAYLQYRARGLEEERLALMEQWLEEAQDALMQLNNQVPQGVSNAPDPAAGAAPGAGDLAQGGPTGGPPVAAIPVAAAPAAGVAVPGGPGPAPGPNPA